MTRLTRLLVVTFIESLATVIVERGIYFYFEHYFGFTGAQNLGAGLGFGLMYIAGALLSQRACGRVGEKRILIWTLWGQLASHALMVLWVIWPTPYAVAGAMVASGFFYGMKWPVMESYVSAGLTPIAVARAVGKFNISWAASVPTALLLSGPMIELTPYALFVLPIGFNLISLWMIRPLEPHPVHLPEDHPGRLPAETMERYRAQLVSARWTMLSSYSLLFLLAPLMPQIFRGLGYTPAVATALAALLDVVRLTVFITFERYQGWHGRAWYLVMCVFGLAIGFVMILPGANVVVVIAGEVIFGLAAGVTYYAALYYAMVVKNASVDAGGAHEGLIGAGFALGPIVGLVGMGIGGTIGATAGVLLSAAPLVVVCSIAGLWPLARVRREMEAPQVEDASG